MKNRLLYFLKYYLFWISYFIVLKILFLFFHFSKTAGLSVKEIAGVFIYGFKLDLSTASYITSSTLLFFIVFSFFKNTVYKKVMYIITLIAIIVCSLLAVGDLELYKYWGYRLDTTPLMYIDTPGEMAASVSWFIIVRQLFIAAALCWVFMKMYKKFAEPEILHFEKLSWWHYPIFLLMLPLMIIPIRGGLKLAPLNTGSAYFSNNTFANHAANNVIWNLTFSFTYYGESTKNPFVFTDMGEAIKVRDQLTSESGQTKHVLRTKRPNIVLIILESFNDKMIASMGGKANVTPNLNRYCKEGICFSNFYGNGDRSDKGLVAIHSGFPAQPIASIIKFPYKTETLPFFTRDLKNGGYHLSYYYGGDINFAAMRSYIQNAGYEEIISDVDFPKSNYGAKWGVHDEYTFQRFYEDIIKSKSPFLRTIFTLSSHEPFDVPFNSEFSGSSEEQKFLNAGKYTDSCLGVFIEKLRNSKMWDSTLVIITADHGSNHPNNSDYYEVIRFKIPMIWLGGALTIRDSTITRIGAQSDIAPTLLSQLSIVPEKNFPYGKNLVDNASNSFAYYSFNNGFGFVTDSAQVVYSNNPPRVLFQEGKSDAKFLERGRSIQQVVYEEFLMKNGKWKMESK